MSTIQNLKNFIRHGKQARAVNDAAFAEPTTNVSTVHAHPQQQQQQEARQQPQQPPATHLDHHALSDPSALLPTRAQVAPRAGDFSVAAPNADNRNVAARAGGVAAHAVGEHQRAEDDKAEARAKGFDPAVVERMVAEERESKGKLPKYPGLERWTLLEKMGDGAFSNVFRARDNTGKMGEVAIKVVRKFEMNASQVRFLTLYRPTCPFPSGRPPLAMESPSPCFPPPSPLTCDLLLLHTNRRRVRI